MAKLSANGEEIALFIHNGMRKVSFRKVTKGKTQFPIRVLTNNAWIDSQNKKQWSGWKRMTAIEAQIANGKTSLEEFQARLEKANFIRQ